MPMTTISGKSRLLSAGFCARTVLGVGLSKKVSPLQRGEYSYDVKLNTSTNMFYPLKNLLYFNPVILRLKCNNSFFNEILVLNDSYVCLLHSHFIKNHPIWILEDGPLIFEVVLSPLM
jgi:hypothetical protein